jgi:hypothetical protein
VVSGIGMIGHAALAFTALLLLPFGWKLPAAIAAVLVLERLVAGVRAASRFGDPAAFIFPVLHLLRDAAWALAIARWIAHRAIGGRAAPMNSMPRERSRGANVAIDPAALAAVMAVIPAFNERHALPAVVADLRACRPNLRVLVVDDGSTDGTFDAAIRLGCDALRLPIRVGVGGAVRAGIRYSRELGYDIVVRIDGDGQHAAADIGRVLGPVLSGAADATSGTRRRAGHEPLARTLTRACLSFALTALLRRRVADPTSGYWAFGPRATRLLALHHPTGYPEPELHLLLHRERLVTCEVPVTTRPRVAGRTSLTAWRAGLALGRALLAMVVVPLRPSGTDVK